MSPIPPDLLTAFPPSAERILHLARQQTDDAMLVEIAKADYGYMADECLAVLRPIRDTGVVPAAMDFSLSEVLNLTRYDAPTQRRGHQTRLFACAVLLCAEDFDSSPDSTLAQSLVSAQVLGEETSAAVGCHLTWRLTQRPPRCESLLEALGLLLLAVRLRVRHFAPPVLGEFAQWVLALESNLTRTRPAFPSERLPRPFSVQLGLWQPLLAEFHAAIHALPPSDARFQLELCGLLLD